jgi:hypothetical protein
MLFRLKTFRAGCLLAAVGGLLILIANVCGGAIGSCGPNGWGFVLMFGVLLLPSASLALLISGVLAFVAKLKAAGRISDLTCLGL